MYACLHSPRALERKLVQEVAQTFARQLEHWAASTIVFSIDPLRPFIGSPYEIASEISRVGYAKKLQANLGIAANPDAAILAACYFLGVTIIAQGEEAERLAPLPLTALFFVGRHLDPGLLVVLEQLGLKCTGELAMLTDATVRKKLGPGGMYLKELAQGASQRPLHLSIQ
jgi:hypothetical protein